MNNNLDRVSEVFQSSKIIPFDDSSNIVLMSDCHRGSGSRTDNFLNNQNIYLAALNYYNNRNYTYIEIGDGDELWENCGLCDIMQAHSDVFGLLSKFYYENRLYFIFGNHDMVKKIDRYVLSNLSHYFKDIKLHEGIVLNHKITQDKILLIHGHQVDYLNDRLWKLSRFLVRYLWKPLESFGINDPTSTAKNYAKKEAVGKKLTQWVESTGIMVIAGHTHKPTFPEIGELPYFNDGSCVHPRSITAIEIQQGSILLVKWSVKAKDDGTLFVGRDVLGGPRNLRDYFPID